MTKSRDLANAATALNAVTAAELTYVDGVTSAIQTQIDTKLATATAATTYVANSLADAKGDLLTATANDTPARLAVGNNGETLVADSSTSTGLRYQGNFAAGKNKILNSDFSIWQRSTSATVTSEDYYAPDRYRSVYVAGGATTTWSRQTFTPGAAPVAGYEGQYFSRIAATSGSGTTVIGLGQKIEDVRTLAGQTVTLSFWAKSDSARTMTVLLVQVFGSGGSSDVFALNTTTTTSTGWTRYSYTVSLGSLSGKTIGSNSYLIPYIYFNTGQASGSPQLDLWGIQLEASNTATAFQTATGTIQGELSACQRYYERTNNTSTNVAYAGFNNSTTVAYASWVYKVRKRVNPTITMSAVADFAVRIPGGTNQGLSAYSVIGSNIDNSWISGTATGLTSGNGSMIVNLGDTGYLEASSEL
jgi:hypothetical protein